MEQKTEFKPFHFVLARNEEDEKWRPEIYSRYDKDYDYPHRVVGGTGYRYCIPYVGNESLAGTPNDPKPKRWRAEEYESYWYIDSSMEVSDCTENNSPFDNGHYEVGNYFKTEEAAVAMVEKLRKVLDE